MTTPIPASVGSSAVDVAERYHAMHIIDSPAHNATIERIIIRACMRWMLTKGKHFDELDDFWCGAFAAFCYRLVGNALIPGQCVDLGLKEAVARFMWASTMRLVGRGPHSWKDVAKMAEDLGLSAPIYVEPEDARRGDLLLVATGRTSRSYGDHIDLCRYAPKDGLIDCIGGNTKGKLPDGTEPPDPWEGICTNTRPLEDIATVIRPAMDWMEGSYLEELT